MKIIPTFVACLFISLITYGQAGMPDPVFGNNGQSLILTNHNSSGSINGIAQQSDGKIVAAGEEYFSTQVYNPLVIRYKTDGSPDSSFGVNGFADVSIKSDHKFDAALVVKILSDGKLLVLINAQNASSGDPDIFLVRFNADGSRDKTFGQNGVVIKNMGIDYAYAMQVQPDGKILLGGQINSIAVVVRCNADGSNDASFGNNGLVYTGSTKYSVITAIAFTSNKKILAGGNGSSVTANTHAGAFVTRYNTNGTTDSSFGVNGTMITQDPAFSQNITSVVVLPGDAFLVSYFLFNNRRYYPMAKLSKYKPAGSIDSTFAKAGTFTSGVPEKFLSYRTSEIAMQQDGKIVLAGQFMNDKAKYAVAVTRLLPGGQTDKSFGNSGTVLTYQYYCKPNTLMIQYDGKIVVGGSIQPKEFAKIQLSLSRYLPGSNAAAQVKKDDAVAAKKLVFFPDPVQDVLHISGLNLSGTILTIVNARGNMVKSIAIKANNCDLNVSELKAGTYYLQVKTNGEDRAYPFIKAE